eukprot:839315-Pyramimonas_sp.AAC.1
MGEKVPGLAGLPEGKGQQPVRHCGHARGGLGGDSRHWFQVRDGVLGRDQADKPVRDGQPEGESVHLERR